MKRISSVLFFLLVFSFFTFAQNNPLDFGNPSGADENDVDNFLLQHNTFVMSYNRSRGAANWVAWHLNKSDRGAVKRKDAFAADKLLPELSQIGSTDYHGKFDRGHMCPSADRTDTPENNKETFVMSNMQAQTGRLNRQTWANLENDVRGITGGTREAYVFAGCFGGTKTINNEGKVVIPIKCFKIVLILPGGSNDVSRVTAQSNIIAAIFPNNTTLPTNWRDPKFLTSIDAIEKATGFDFFSELPDSIEKALEARMSNK
ncbi:MAG TPA: DNA/RNA non-specific endonuclease [Pyrinomonadaceae bacterium]|jgi:endonuclease G|nr:DNA/RNA non-specific endonuclease [Pyrinomonadaceae bacterium]